MNIVLTLTTIPSRLINQYNYDLEYCIKSLMEQNHDNYQIHFNIPNSHNQTGEEYILPDWLVELNESTDKLNVFRTEDYGPITKLLPTIQRIDDSETIIIVVDDDIIYNPEMINEHLKNREKWPDFPVGYDGLTSINDDGSRRMTFGNNRDYFFSANGIHSYVEIIQHYKSVSYKRSMFGDDFFKFIEDNGVWCDDTTVSAYFAMNRVPRVVTFFEGDEVAETFEDWLNVVGVSFPVIKSTEHDTMEGCQIFRQDDKDIEKFNKLNQFLAMGYVQ